MTITTSIRSWKFWVMALYALGASSLYVLYDPARSEAGSALIVVAACVLISVLEVIPVWGMTIVLWLLAPVVLFRFGDEFRIWSIITGSLHSVLIVFLAGFMFAAAARRHGIDERLTDVAVRSAGADHWRLLALLAAVTVWLSAWISNVAAAALMFGSARHLVTNGRLDANQRRSVLLTIAVAANLGGMATPIASGPNAIAVAAAMPDVAVTFIEWMAFSVPLTIATVAATGVLAVLCTRPARDHARPSVIPKHRPIDRRTAIIFGGTVAAWLLEPLHGLPAHLTAAIAIVLLVATRAVTLRDLITIDWGTLVLIAGGIGIGTVISRSGAAETLVASLPLQQSGWMALFLLCCLSAAMAALMSNTGTAALLIPIGMALQPLPSTAILIALATAFGFPFVISTPANALAVRHGVFTSDLLRVGVVAMIVGCALLALTGRTVLRFVGIP